MNILDGWEHKIGGYYYQDHGNTRWWVIRSIEEDTVVWYWHIDINYNELTIRGSSYFGPFTSAAAAAADCEVAHRPEKERTE